MGKKRNLVIYIPAKKNSERLRNKNIKKLDKKPLFEYSLDFAIELKKEVKKRFSDYFNQKQIYVVFDSDINLPSKYEGKVVYHEREKKYLKTTIAVALKRMLKNVFTVEGQINEKTMFVVLQPTTPFRNMDNVCSALFLALKKGFVVSAKKMKNPIFYTEYGIKVSLPKGTVWMETGSFFIFDYPNLLTTSSLSGYSGAEPFEDKMFLQDIDTSDDWEYVKWKIKQLGGKN